MKIKAVLLVAGLGFVVSAVQAAEGRPQLAAKKISMCIGCHGIPGYRASFPEVYSVPKLGGQHAAYIVAALSAYKSGERTNTTMHAIATALSDQDMADIAAYYSEGK
ncbi:MAG TPA: cytochrome c [Rhodocyclaceae bacterium]|nr:cytochrome c [Rhodocyclaceae bacterium]